MELITDIEQLSLPSKPLEFLTDIGVDKTDGDRIMTKMREFMEAHAELVSLSAKQIGEDARIFCIRFSDTIKFFINPVITKKSGMVIGAETFNSAPGKEYLVGRPEEITSVYYTNDYKYEDNKFLGPAAKLFDQQAQLLDGVLPSDIGLESDIEKDGSLSDLTEEEAAELSELYKQYIQAKLKSSEGALKDSKDLSRIYQTLKVTEGVVNGRIEIMEDDATIKTKEMMKTKARNESAKASFNKFINKGIK